MLERVWRKGNPLTLLVEMQTSTATMENSVEIPLKTMNKTTMWHSSPTPRRIPWGTRIEKDTCIPLFTAALFAMTRTRKQPRCPSTDEWINTCGQYTQWNIQFSSVTQLCPTLSNSMNCSTPGPSVYHQLLEFTQTHVHWVGDAIQPSHSLLFPSPPAFNLSQHQCLFQWFSSSNYVTKVLEI